MNVLKKIVNSVILTINVGVVLSMIICGFAYKLKPDFSSLSPFLCYAFPIFAFLNLFFIVYWLVRLRPWILISIIGLILTFSSYRAWFPLNYHADKKSDNSIKILSYNVMYFQYNIKSGHANLHPIFSYLQNSNADIICLQEVGPEFLQKGAKYKELRDAFKSYRYVVSGASENRYSVVCLSKFPVICHHRIKYESKSNSSFYYDIKIKDDTIRLVNNHLESNKLNSKEKNKYSDFIKKRESNQFASVAETLGLKVGNASIIRANQADSVSKVVTQSPYKVIVCGDFNDVPGSYTYRTIRKGLLDSWIENGVGWGNTYHENLFLFRIDYILHSPDILSYETKVDKVKLSDHYPIWANLDIQ